MKQRHARTVFMLSLGLGFATAAHAHTGAGPTSGFVNGFMHPLAGLDHLCAMLAVGLWAGQRGGRALWLVPATFVTVMALGGFVGALGLSLPLVEPGIVASVLVLGALIAAGAQLPLVASALIVGLFAVLHGHAHGTEMADTVSGLGYGTGFLLSTALLHAAGIGLALGAGRVSPSPALVRVAGGLIVACGLYLVLA